MVEVTRGINECVAVVDKTEDLEINKASFCKTRSELVFPPDIPPDRCISLL